MTPTEERIRHYLNQLPEPYRSQALSQVDPEWFKSSEPEQIESKRDAVREFAAWTDTEEKYDYWNVLHWSLPKSDSTESIQSEINELQYRIDTLKEELKNLTK